MQSVNSEAKKNIDAYNTNAFVSSSAGDNAGVK